MQTSLSSPLVSNAEILVSVPAKSAGNSQAQPVSKQVEQNLDQLASSLESLAEDATLELSIVMPCLNEADTVRACVRKALQSLRQ